jgi:glycosyltransferase involved in cell wall biosynthesis
MRFLMLNWRDPKSPLAGGAERVTLAYLVALAERGHEVYWYANDFPGAQREETFQGIKIVRGGGKGTSVLKAIQWYRRQKRFDLVIDQHHGIAWFAPWWAKTNCVAYIHEILGPIWNSFYSWPVNAIGRRQERWTHWAYRRVPFFTASAFTREQLLKHGVRTVKIIPYGVHTRALSVLAEKPLSAPLRLIAVSRLAPNKRIDHAIRTLRCLIDLGVAAELTVVGTGGDEARLKALAVELHLQAKVNFTGLQSEIEKDARLSQSHFLLHTSQREGWGLNVIEANAMGTPAAVYPVAGLIESTLHDETGLVAAAESPAALATALRDSLNAPERYQYHRRRAWERSKEFHWDQVLPKSCAWFEAMARGEHVP